MFVKNWFSRDLKMTVFIVKKTILAKFEPDNFYRWIRHIKTYTLWKRTVEIIIYEAFFSKALVWDFCDILIVWIKINSFTICLNIDKNKSKKDLGSVKKLGVWIFVKIQFFQNFNFFHICKNFNFLNLC